VTFLQLLENKTK